MRPPLYYYRDKDKNEIDLDIVDGDVLYPIEIKTTSDPGIKVVNAFRYLANVPGKTVGTGAVICLSRNRLPLTENVWILPVHLI